MRSALAHRLLVAATLLAVLPAASCSSESGTESTGGSGSAVTTAATSTESVRPGLTFGAYDSIALGMSKTEVEAAGYILGTLVQADGCNGYERATDPNGKYVGLFFRPGRDLLSRIVVESGTAALPAASASVTEVRAAYPGATIAEVPAFGQLGDRITVADPSRSALIIYQLSGQTVAHPMTAFSTAPGCPLQNP